MPGDLFQKLIENIDRTGNYPPVVVRPDPFLAGGYQILDGHNRVAALSELGEKTATCFNWPCNDRDALVLLATLNRLEGQDVPIRRAGLLDELSRLLPAEELALLLPETARQIDETLELLDLDIEKVLVDLEAANDKQSSTGPRLISFLVEPDDELVILDLLNRRAATLQGRNRRGRALAIICSEQEKVTRG